MQRINPISGQSTPARLGLWLMLGATELTTAGCITTGSKQADATKVEAGFGQNVTGLNNLGGDIARQPTDQAANETGCR